MNSKLLSKEVDDRKLVYFVDLEKPQALESERSSVNPSAPAFPTG
jgi:hypothetical protein